jgi:integrase
LKKERPELFQTTAERQRIRVHDLRGSFVTVLLANSRSESWIADRTGHRSSAMINRYKRISRTFEELDLGALAPLCDAVPELRGPPAAANGGPQGGPRIHDRA